MQTRAWRLRLPQVERSAWMQTAILEGVPSRRMMASPTRCDNSYLTGRSWTRP